MGPSTTLDLPPVAPARATRPRDRLTAHALATEVARRHGEALMRTARKYAGDPDDAHDAYQRALELLLEHAPTIDRTKVLPWMHVVVRREASALRRRHDRHLPFDVDAVDARQASDRTDEHLSRIDLALRAGEALATLKDTEAQALCLRAQGLSYDEIADTCGWTYTKVNRAVSEGRKAFVDHYLGAERGDLCEHAGERLGAYLAGDLRSRDHIRIRAHLIRCSACRAQLHAERTADDALRALLPPAVIATGTHHSWLHEHLLAPANDLAARLTPAAEHALTAKLGVATISTLAVASGGLTIQHVTTQPGAPPTIRAALSAPAATTSTPAAASPITAVGTATTTGQTIIDDARARARDAAKRRATARRRAAAKRARQRTAAAREFSPATTEFAPSTGATSDASRATNQTPTQNTPTTAQQAPIEVPSTDTTTGNDITVTEAP